ncbi:uncharacterized protein L969DRAFT_623066 [Mixia osmundae IAM 14324]|uniref:Transmembrane 9 superfamily member n=1 Tax=Mixia osmundae (strain CBS 9802 / IAM 14324 / JCM 22182 / KY 12970) TaxID=764103 RepID=G7DVS7_MIXOS|nr:uncharacterized protein L969DRAFT_623066 [Mixia osmundae IAM 14324]KEI39632.1 hypothetical protein L969DRAFT_623066 [Mixia osmundae IAM 14324]GAA94687.1 hypothetical protein E5Q_01340 [Mixia osmundae IAM 14324]
MAARAACLALAIGVLPVHSFYLPGSAPAQYKDGDRIPVLVNALTPQIAPHAQLKSVISYNYYEPAFGFCQPPDGPKQQSEALGSILFGDRIYSAPFEIDMMRNTSCRVLCAANISSTNAQFVNQRIREDYTLNVLIDGLPAAEMKKDDRTNEIFYSSGFELGDDSSLVTGSTSGTDDHSTPTLHTHYNFYLEYHDRSDGTRRVVGAVVWPRSIDSGRPSSSNGEADCYAERSYRLSETADNEFFWTYSVYWTPSATPWATRWDHYLHIFDPRIHWFSLINSIVIAVFLCIMVGTILARAVQKDLSRYNAIDLEEDVTDDMGWKLLHADVFRPPQKASALSVTIGSGSQLAAMTGVTLIFALLGFLSPSNRGLLPTVMIVCWTFFGSISGYVSARLYATFNGQNWKTNLGATALTFPTILFGALNLLNFFLLTSGSSGAVPFGTMVAIVLLWFCISIPLVIVGGVFGVRQGPISMPVRTNAIPRQIPPTIWYLRAWPSAILAGVLPFSAVFIELFFVMSSLFGNKVYYAFGFMTLCMSVVVLTTATVTVLMTYFALCAEDYRWQWRAFLCGGGSAFWVFIYGLSYWASRLSLNGLSLKVLYLGYLSLVTLVTFLIGGSIGFIASFVFMRKIYSHLRVD